MLFIYSILVTLAYILALPLLVYLWLKPKYKKSIPARFFLKDNPPFLHQGIWFHAASLGEIRSLKPFIDALNTKEINISVITQTGFNEAIKYQYAHVRYLPFELFLPFWMKKQNVLIVLEAELWPMLFYVAKAKRTKTILLNARISDRSYASYLRFAVIYRWIFRFIDTVFAQTALDKERLESLGARNVHVSGNIKTFQRYAVTHDYQKESNKRVVVLASTHEKEEALILSRIELLPNDKLIVVPRHPERFDAVDAFLKVYAQEKGRSYGRLSHHEYEGYDVVLCDKMGELINFYAIADVVILGGSFVQGVGGHNPLEPAFFGVKLISGTYTFNQNALFPLVENVIVCDEKELKEVFAQSQTMLASRMIHSGDIAPILKEIIG